MRRKILVAVTLAISSAVPLPAPLLESPRVLAEEIKRFLPEEHLPAGALVYASVANARRFTEKLKGTSLGKIASHPGWGLAFGEFTEKLQQKMGAAWQPFARATGKTPLEILDLLRGEVAFALRVPEPFAAPEVVVAVELGETSGEIQAVLAHLQRFVEEASGQKLETRAVGGLKATVWPGPAGPIFHALLGTHLLVVSSPDLLRDIASAFEGNTSGKPSHKQGELRAELSKPLQVNERELLLEVDLTALRRLAAPLLESGSGDEEVRRILEVTGLDHLTSGGAAVGFQEGEMEIVLHVGMRDGARGFLELLQKGFTPLKDPEAALILAPASAHEFEAASMAPGKIFRGAVELLRRSIPEAGERLDSFFRMIEEKARITVEGDVFALEDITFFAFAVEPPAGGLFSDQIVLVRTQPFQSYLSLLRKLAAAAGADVRSITTAAESKIDYVILASGKALGPNLFDRLFSPRSTEEPSPLSFLALLVPVVAWTELPDGWTAFSTVPQALARYLQHYARGPKLSEVPVLADMVRAQAPGASVTSVFEGGKNILWAYNSIIGLASAFAPLLAQAGIDLAPLPPAEVFQGSFRPGFLRLSTAPDGFTLRGRQLLSSFNLCAAAGAGAVLAAIAVPALVKVRARAQTEH